MDNTSFNTGAISEDSADIGSVSPEMVSKRAHELALLAGCVPPHVRQADLKQALRELTQGTEIEVPDTVLEASLTVEGDPPVPIPSGTQALETPNEDEDSEGRSESEQLFDSGVEEAEHERLLQAARAAYQNEGVDL